MSVLPDYMIRALAEQSQMIVPFVDYPDQVNQKGVSYGLTSYGYDLRLGHNFRVLDSWSKMHGGVIDPKSTNWHQCLTSHIGVGEITIPANSFALGESLEVLKIPRRVIGVCLGKSTYARCAVVANVTPLEPEWEGKVTIEISNTSPLPATIYAGEGILQVLFLEGTHFCERSYAAKKGRYQGQTGLTMPRVQQ